jgi:hypothetical protein
MLFFILAIIWMLFGLLFIPLVKDITKISLTWLLIPVSILFGIPIVFVTLGINPKRFDISDDIINDDTHRTGYLSEKSVTYKSFEDYLSSINLSKNSFIRETEKLLEKHPNNKDIEGIFLDSDEWIIEEINNAQLPYGVVPIGITTVGDIIGVETQSKEGFSLVIIDLELNPEVYKWKDNGNYPKLEK